MALPSSALGHGRPLTENVRYASYARGLSSTAFPMAEIAVIEPTPRRISYRHTLMLIRNFWLTAWLAPPGVLPRRLEALHDELALLLLPPRRSQRRFPRAVKIKMSNHPFKRSQRRRRRVI